MAALHIPSVSYDEGQQCGFGRFPVTIIPQFRLRLSDGVHLSLKFWFPFHSTYGTEFEECRSQLVYDPPEPADEVPQPAVIEYLPYRKTDFTLERDWRHLWMSSHGYVCVRIDMRGTGDSEGLYLDEYLKQEQDDGVEVIEWLAARAWSNGSVGIIGKSWGGFNGLQLAYLQPKGLKAIVTVYSTDDRYASDKNFEGGCLRASDFQSWGCQMFAWNARGPNPHFVPNWKELWRERLSKASKNWLHNWMPHLTRDAFWKHGSVCEDPARIQIPVLAVGGWVDGYVDAVFRMAKTLPQFRGIIGPWGHGEFPELATPGPNIDYMGVCLQWWDEHLKSCGSRMKDMPLLQLYLQDQTPPLPAIAFRRGRWVKQEEWPPKAQSAYMHFVPESSTGNLIRVEDGIKTSEPVAVPLPFSTSHGLLAGEWNATRINDRPTDQRAEDAHCLTWTTRPLAEDVSVLGNPVFQCSFSVKNTPSAMLAVRLCHVHPDGRSTRISYGVFNLTHREGHDKVTPLEDDHVYSVEVELVASSYVVPKGHQIRVAVSQSYWPMIWLPKQAADMSIHIGMTKGGGKPDQQTQLILPVYQLTPDSKDDVAVMLGNPNTIPPARTKMLKEPSYRQHASIDTSSGTRAVRIKALGGQRLIPETDTTLEENCYKLYSVQEGEPLTAEAYVEHQMEYKHENLPDGPVHYTIATDSKMWADDSHFHVQDTLQVQLNGEEFFQKTWTDKFERNGV